MQTYFKQSLLDSFIFTDNQFTTSNNHGSTEFHFVNLLDSLYFYCVFVCPEFLFLVLVPVETKMKITRKVCCSMSRIAVASYFGDAFPLKFRTATAKPPLGASRVDGMIL